MSACPCPRCGVANGATARFCANCGERAPVPAPTDRGALAAAALALLSLGGAGTIAAIVLGHRATRRIAASRGAVRGRRLALAALGVAYATLACALAVGAYVVFVV